MGLSQNDINKTGLTCNLCGWGDFSIVENRCFPYQVLQCEHCRLVFVHPFPERRQLEDHYNTGYYEAWTGPQRSARLNMWAKRLERVEQYSTKGCLLDVGCGEGSFLETALKNGWKAKGTEISRYTADHGANRLHVPIYAGELYEAGYVENSFDVVTMWHVLEHVRNPLGYLREARRILKPSGLLVVAVPNLHDYLMQAAYLLVRLKKLRLFNPKDRELHLYHFSAATLTACLDKAGFSTIHLGPDFGILETGKKIINYLASVPFYLGGWKYFNSLEVFARPRSENGHHNLKGHG